MAYQINSKNPIQQTAFVHLAGQQQYITQASQFARSGISNARVQTLPTVTQLPANLQAKVSQSQVSQASRTQVKTIPQVGSFAQKPALISFPKANYATLPRQVQYQTTMPGLSNSRVMLAQKTISPQKVVYVGGRSPQKVMGNLGPYSTNAMPQAQNQAYSTVTGLQLQMCIFSVRGLADNADMGSKPDPFVRYFIGKLDSSEEKQRTQTIDNSTDATFNHTGLIDLSKIPQAEVASQNLNIVVYDKDMVSSSQMGGVHVPLREAIFQQGKWVNKWYELRDKEGKDGIGAVQVAFKLVSGIQGPIQPPPAIPYAVEEQIQAITFPGYLNVNVKCARNLKSSFLDKSDPFIQLKLNKGSNNKRKSETIDDNPNPVWDFKTKFDCDVKQDDWTGLTLDFSIWDYDLASNDLLGKNEIDLGALFSQPHQWINQEFSLKDSKDKPLQGSCYIQIQWEPKTAVGYPYQLPQLISEPANILGAEWEKLQGNHNEKKEKALKKLQDEFPSQPIIEGTLNIYAVQAKDLEAKDTFGSSDGYVEFKVSSNLVKKTWHTKTINKNLNPEWQENGSIDISMPQEKFTGLSLTAEVYDNDIGGDDLIGKVTIPLDEALSHMQGRWINQIYPLVDKSEQNSGKPGILSMMYQWKPKDINFNEEAPNPLDINSFYRGCKPKGTVIVGCVQANYLLGVKEGQLSDPWVKMYFDGVHKSSKELSNTVNPQWNELFEFKANYANRSRVPQLKVEVFSGSGGMFSSAEFIGQFETNITQILDFPNQWGTYQMYDLEDPEKRCKKGAVQGKLTLKLGFATEKQYVSAMTLQ